MYLALRCIRHRARWFIPLVALGLVTVMLLAWGYSLRNNEPEFQKLLDSIPLGTSPHSVETLFDSKSIWASKVTRCEYRNKTLHRQELGEFENLRGLLNQGKSFTGEVTLFVHRPFEGSVALTFIYDNNQLVKKDWGYLPG